MRNRMLTLAAAVLAMGSAHPAIAHGEEQAARDAVPDPNIALPAPSTPPLTLTTEGVTFYGDVSYGPASANRFDLFLPASGTPTGLVIFIHGGGFQNGDRSQAYHLAGWPERIDALLAAGIAFATIDYTLATSPDWHGMTTALGDSTRALQFLRYNAKAINVAPFDIALAGTSAGAGSSLYIGVGDSLADPSSPDIVLRQPTSVRGVYGDIPQASYDMRMWSSGIFESFAGAGFDISTIERIVTVPAILRMYGIASLSDLDAPAMQPILARMDMLENMGPDDPPLYLSSWYSADFPTDFNTLVHHPLMVASMAARADAEGRPIKASASALGLDTTGGETPTEFLIGLFD